MKRSMLMTLAIVSACAASAQAADFDANVSVGAEYSSITGNKFKANEYRSIGSGINNNLDLQYRNPEGYKLSFEGSNFLNFKPIGSQTDTAVQDQNYLFKVGKTDNFKASVFYQDFTHNLSPGLTFFSGVGTNSLIFVPSYNAIYGTQAFFNNLGFTTTSTSLVAGTTRALANNMPTTTQWNQPINYAIERKNYGAEGEVSFSSPYFFNVRVERNQQTGVTPFLLTTSLREVPAPVDYSTDNLFIQTGYRSNNLTLVLDGTLSNFNNANPAFSMQMGTWNNLGTTFTYPTPSFGYLPPNNNYYKIGGSAMYRIPVMDTTLMVRASHSITENHLGSEVNLERPTNLTAANAMTWSMPSVWHGKYTYTTASASITSNPLSFLETKLFYNFLDKQNISTSNVYYNTNNTDFTERFGYHKQNAGMDLGFKLPASTKLAVGYEYLDLNRSLRSDATRTVDNSGYIQLKNDALDFLSVKARYDYLKRGSNFLSGDVFWNDPAAVTTSTGSSNLIFAYFRPADTADKNQHKLSFDLDLEPAHGLTFGTQYVFKNNDYTKSALGIQDDTRHEAYFDVTYAMDSFLLNLYGDFETVETNYNFRAALGAGYSPTTPLYPSPYGPNDVNNFNWTSKRTDFNYALGVKTSFDIIKNLLNLKAGYRYEEANGTNDLATNTSPIQLGYRGTGYTWSFVAPLSSSNVDNYTKHTFDAKLNYKFNKNVNMDLGYLYEKLKYVDDAYAGYQYFVPSNTLGTAGNILSGAYANPNYTANVVYMNLNVKF